MTVQSATTFNWRATFSPIKDRIHGYSWIDFVHVDLLSDDRRVVAAMVREDARDDALVEIAPDSFSRKMVSRSANHSLVLGGAMGATVYVDNMHGRVLRARLARGQARPVFGPEAVHVLFPDVERMSWQEVDEARGIDGLRRLRAVLAEVEEAAHHAAETASELDSAIEGEYRRRLEQAIEDLRPSLHRAAGAAGIGVLIGLLTGTLPIALGLATGAAYQVAEGRFAEAQYRRSWMAANDRLRAVNTSRV